MFKRLAVSGFGLCVSLMAMAFSTPVAEAPGSRCSSGEVVAEAMAARALSAEAGKSCALAFCTYSCDEGPLPGNSFLCANPCFAVCGPWGGYCGDGCITVVCASVS